MTEFPATRIQVLGDMLRDAAAKYADQDYILCDGEWLSYGQVDDQSDRLAASLQSLGVRKGDRVAIMLPNCDEYVFAIFAIAKIGAIQVPINTYLKGEFLRHQMAESGAAVVLVDVLGARQIASVADMLPDLRVAIGLDDCDAIKGALIGTELDIHSYETCVASASAPMAVELAGHDLCVILYTSGTTGPSKGCMISHGYYTWIPEILRRAGWHEGADTLMTATPLFHTNAQIWVLASALSCGGRAIIEPVFHASTFIDRAGELGATVIRIMGSMVNMILAQSPKESDKSHGIRLATCVPTTPETWKLFFERFAIPINSEVYGQTECNPATITPAGIDLTPGGAGKVAPHVELKILDEGDNEVVTGEVGEIVVRPLLPNVMFSGYWNNPDATAKAWRNLWHHTGDYGRLDEEGTLFFADRKSDSLRRRGENISSTELEEALLQHASIAAAAVHGVPSPVGEDDIKACVVLTGGSKITPEELFEFFKGALPYYAVPRYVEVMDEFPKSVVNRVQKFKLRERGITDSTWDFEAMGLVIGRDERRR
ncbi:AMP-binding protein [Sphingopyxis macrogoltabida]|uniref:AMP-binding protein n=1 Tax=Sphingopyxis macrogoltabida TaxID=33050 RepID=UPI0006ED3D15|nr:AMP-binding protein [Sphingopyxis macrogoltabida]ALJ16388.1 hypothetical protein LH19_26675 [Sphingopyxis macrogoltabida]